MYKVSRLDWQDIYQEYRISGLTKSAFLKDRFAALWPNAKQPSRTTFFNRIRQLEKQLCDRNESLACIDEPSELSEGAAPSVRVVELTQEQLDGLQEPALINDNVVSEDLDNAADTSSRGLDLRADIEMILPGGVVVRLKSGVFAAVTIADVSRILAASNRRRAA